MIAIDAHQHFWSLARGDYDWIDSSDHLSPIRRDYLPRDLAPLLSSTGIDRTILVQAAPTIAETEFLLALAEQQTSIAAVVGWIDFNDRDHLAHLERFARHPKFVGLRPMIQDIADVDWMLSAPIQWAFEAIIAHDLTFDALGHPAHIENFHRLFRRYPTMRAVIDHGLKPSFRRRQDTAWFTGLKRLADDTSACCKLSGLVTEAGAGWTVDQLQPYVDHLLACFGPDRLMWGSDWPVLDLASTYQTWHTSAHRLVGQHPGSDMIFGGTAKSFYRQS